MDDLEQDVRWVASQSPIPALQALIREAERDKHGERTHSLPASPPPPAPAPTPPAAPAHRPPRVAHATAVRDTYVPNEDEPEAVAFVELLRDAFKTLDENSLKKQRLAARAREKERTLARDRADSATAPATSSLGARPLARTSSASAICRAAPSTSAPQLASSSSFDPGPRRRVLEKTVSMGVVPGKSLPTHILDHDPKRLPARAFTRAPTSGGADSPMQDVIDLTETDTELERPMSTPISYADTTMCMEVDDDDSDDRSTRMDVSFFLPDPSPPTPVPAPTPRRHFPQPNTVPRPPAPIQRPRAGPPPLGMRRAHLPPTSHGASQSTKSVAAPRFKPPLLANAGVASSKSANGTRPATMTNSNSAPRQVATRVTVAPKARQESQDADSSFDLSFDVDGDALEEAMKAYD